MNRKIVFLPLPLLIACTDCSISGEQNDPCKYEHQDTDDAAHVDHGDTDRGQSADTDIYTVEDTDIYTVEDTDIPIAVDTDIPIAVDTDVPIAVDTDIPVVVDVTASISWDADESCYYLNHIGEIKECGPSETPTPGIGFTKIVTAGHYSCALHSTGIISCWASSTLSVSNISINDFTDVAITTDVYDSPNVCGVRNGGSVYCWQHPSPRHMEPEHIPSRLYTSSTSPQFNDAKSIFFYSEHVPCIVRRNNYIYCWTSGNWGQSDVPVVPIAPVAYLSGDMPVFTNGCWGFDYQCPIDLQYSGVNHFEVIHGSSGTYGMNSLMLFDDTSSIQGIRNTVSIYLPSSLVWNRYYVGQTKSVTNPNFDRYYNGIDIRIGSTIHIVDSYSVTTFTPNVWRLRSDNIMDPSGYVVDFSN